MIHELLYKRKREQRWWRYLVLREAYQSAQNEPRPEGALAGAFRKLGYGAPGNAVIECWNALVQLGARKSPRLDINEIKLLEERVTQVDADSLPALAWLDLYRLGIGAGLFLTANTFREKAIECSIVRGRGKNPALADVVRGFYGTIERGSYEAADQLLEVLPRYGLSSQKLEQARWVLDLYSGQRLTDQIGFGSQASPEDIRFGDCVRGRSVALVGPVPTDEEHGEEIDKHDIVVKFSYRGGEKGRDPITQGRRLDISYYNNTQAQTLAEDRYSEVLAMLEWGVCINRKGRECFPERLEKMRQITSLQWLLPDTHFNAGPNALIDLLRFHPGGVKVFNTDLMLSAGRYAGYRPEGAKPIEYTRSFIKTHDPVLQYVTMHRLWELGFIVGDLRFESVMRMGLPDYLAKLQRVHGAHEQALL
ncbi:MAG: hypothetical protein ACQEV6_15250 [Pseudomonadota bacterium]